MAFSDMLALDGAGVVWLVDVSFDDFASVSYRWSNIATKYGGNDYQARTVRMSQLTRGLGFDHLVQAGHVELLLDNSDFGADFLVDRATVATQVFRARFKLTVLMYDPSLSYTDAPAMQAKVMGTFKCLDYPSRDNASVRVPLADDMLGAFDSPLTAPTIREWRDDAGSSHDNCPIHADYIPIPNIDWDVPVQLAFGYTPFNCFMAEAVHEQEFLTDPGEHMNTRRAIIVCATRDVSAVSDTDITTFAGVYGSDARLGSQPYTGAGSTVTIPRTFTTTPVPPTVVTKTYTIWVPRKTQALTKDGVTWSILWIELNMNSYDAWWKNNNNALIKGGVNADGSVSPAVNAAPTSPSTVWTSANPFGAEAAAFTHFKITGTRLSSVSGPPDGVTVLRDLFKYYSKAGTAGVDDTSFDEAYRTNGTQVAGTIIPTRVLPLNESRFSFRSDLPTPAALAPGLLRKAVSEICASIDVDIVLTWSGLVKCVGSWLTFANLTATRTALEEARCGEVVERTPSQGERWAPYNRLFVIAPNGSTHGPYVNQSAITAWGTTIDRTFEGRWLSSTPLQVSSQENTIWNIGPRLESVVRPVVRFVSDRVALGLELGDLFDFVWSRGGSAGPYNTAAVFRVESMTVNPNNLDVVIEAVWVDDIRTTFPFLVDDETLLLRVASSAGRTATCADGNAQITMASGNLITDGVAHGDIIVLKDSTQAANAFSRYRQLFIDTVAAGFVTVIDSDLNFSGGSAVVDWEIRRGKITYPTSSTDPVNYPNDGTMYGKACSAADLFTDASNANRLL